MSLDICTIVERVDCRTLAPCPTCQHNIPAYQCWSAKLACKARRRCRRLSWYLFHSGSSTTSCTLSRWLQEKETTLPTSVPSLLSIAMILRQNPEDANCIRLLALSYQYKPLMFARYITHISTVILGSTINVRLPFHFHFDLERKIRRE
jgi:hypothetical protein